MVSILFPTRQRRDYLAVALASVAPQAAARGAEIIVVEDDPHDPQMAALAERHGARYIAHGAPRGLNAARNTAIEAAGSDLFCFLDDDVEVWPGWLDAMLTGAAAYPEHEVLGGPIRARLEGSRLRSCGREPLPVTTLDLGAEDTDAAFAWGANLTLRRAAIERVGRLRRVAADLWRRGGVPAPPEGRRRTDPVHREGRRRPPSHRQGREGLLAGALRVLPRAQLAPQRRPQADRAPPHRRVAHAGRVRLAHRAARLRRRDRAHRAERRPRRRDLRSAPAAAEHERSRLPLRPLRHARHADGADRHAARPAGAASPRCEAAASCGAPHTPGPGGGFTSSASRGPSSCAGRPDSGAS